MLNEQIAEWTESVTEARRELALVELARRLGPGAEKEALQIGNAAVSELVVSELVDRVFVQLDQAETDLTVPEEEAGLELDMAQTDLAALIEAERLLQTVASQLDEPGRVTLGLVVKLLYDVDPWRPDWLAGDIERLRKMRLRMLGAAN